MFSGTPAGADLGTVIGEGDGELYGNDGSVSDTFDIVLSATVASATAPDAPASLGATAGDAQVTLSWTPPGSDGGAPISKYQYRYSAGSRVDPETAWTDVSDGSDTDGEPGRRALGQRHGA